jgi:type IV secretion system protein VirB6
MMACQSLPAASFIGGVIDFVDCQAQAIGSGGYQALAAPGSTLSVALTGLLTLFVALFGYRMLFGHTPGVRDGVLALVKIGIVLALALSWPAYRTLIYDVALKGPAELSAEIGSPAALPGAGGGLVARLDNADRFLVALAVLGPGDALATPQSTPQALVAPPPMAGFDALALGGARMLFLSAAIAALGAVRLIAGLLLALGPFFFAFLLFDATRGLFEGWLRVLSGAALGALGTAVALGVELALLEPWLASLYAQRTAGLATPGAPVELLVVTFVFALVLIAMLIAAARVAYGFRMPPAWRSATAQLASTLRADEQRLAAAAGGPAVAAAAADRSRAAVVADAVAATQRRESGPVAVADAGAAGASPRQATRHALANDLSVPAPQPLGQSFRRRTGTRHSASAVRRDRGS